MTSMDLKPHTTTTPLRTRVYTSWGTVLFYDPASGQLRHGAIDTSPDNVGLEADSFSGSSLRASLVELSGDLRRPIVALADQTLSRPNEGNADSLSKQIVFNVISLEDAIVGLEAGGLFLSAQPDGRITLSRRWCRRWEFFVLSEEWLTPSRKNSATSKENETFDINKKELETFLSAHRLRYDRELNECRLNVAAILRSISAKKRYQHNGNGRAIIDRAKQHFKMFAPLLKRRIQLVIYGVHSADWMTALAPNAKVWEEIEFVSNVLHVPAAKDKVAIQSAPDRYPILIPLMEHHAKRTPSNIATLSPQADVINLLADKGLFAAYLLEKDLGPFFPSTFFRLDDIQFPCVVKPRNSSGGRGIDLIYDRATLRRTLESKMQNGEHVIVQSWIKATDEYVTHAVLRRGTILWDATLHFGLEDQNVLRTSRVTAQTEITRVATPVKLRDVLIAITHDLDLEGPVNVDFKIVDGDPIIFEINPRLGGSLMRPENVDLLRDALNAIIAGAISSDNFFAGIIRNSPMFDNDFYMGADNEFEQRPADPCFHYFCEGFREGRDPSEYFSTNDYSFLHFGTTEAEINPLIHFEIAGRKQNLPIVSKERRRLRTEIANLTFKRADGLTRDCADVDFDSAEEGMTRRTYLSKLGAAEAQKIIQDRGLTPVKGAWHYSWDLQRFFKECYLYENGAHSYVFCVEPIPYVSAPAPLFSDDDRLAHIIARKGRHLPFWFLHLGSFDAFLERRSMTSSRPNAHFPTRQTYRRVIQEKGASIRRFPLFEYQGLFAEHFTRWKAKRFNFNGNDCVKLYISVNPNVPRDWFYFYLLLDSSSDSGRGVMLTIEDGRSAALLNVANEPGFGSIMIVEGLKLMAGLNYSSFNGGVSGVYNYKQKIFLDRIDTDATGVPPIGQFRHPATKT